MENYSVRERSRRLQYLFGYRSVEVTGCRVGPGCEANKLTVLPYELVPCWISTALRHKIAKTYAGIGLSLWHKKRFRIKYFFEKVHILSNFNLFTMELLFLAATKNRKSILLRNCCTSHSAFSKRIETLNTDRIGRAHAASHGKPPTIHADIVFTWAVTKLHMFQSYLPLTSGSAKYNRTHIRYKRRLDRKETRFKFFFSNFKAQFYNEVESCMLFARGRRMYRVVVGVSRNKQVNTKQAAKLQWGHVNAGERRAWKQENVCDRRTEWPKKKRIQRQNQERIHANFTMFLVGHSLDWSSTKAKFLRLFWCGWGSIRSSYFNFLLIQVLCLTHPEEAKSLWVATRGGNYLVFQLQLVVVPVPVALDRAGQLREPATEPT